MCETSQIFLALSEFFKSRVLLSTLVCMAAASVLFFFCMLLVEARELGEGTAQALLLSLVQGGGERTLSFGFPISTDCALANVQHHL